MASSVRPQTMLVEYAAICICVFLICPTLFSQIPNVSKPATDRETQNYIGAANAWRLAPVSQQSQIDPVDPELRDRREKWWSEITVHHRDIMGDFAILTPAATPPSTITHTTPEVDQVPNGTWVIADFDSYQIYEVQAMTDFMLIYTEINYHVIQVIAQPSNLSLMPGNIFQEGLRGGRVKKADGTIDSSVGPPLKYFPRPKETYLLQVTYDPATHYYKTVNRWDINTGTLVADTYREAGVVAQKRPVFSGLLVSQAIQLVNSMAR